MDEPTLRLWITAKLDEGTLPSEGMPRVWGGPGSGQPCDACEKIITNVDLEIEGIRSEGGTVRFHVKCFQVWDAERREEGHQPSGPA